jgi:chromosome segregation protein
LHLTRLQALGFKSFAQKLDMPFQNGVTCVVGPNGCGKSNVVDALRWALGEQRPRSLRSGSMGDVIFTGTRTRKPLGMAEVSITLDNSLKQLPTDFAEVTVTRRLFRSGESDYLLNKIPCRLKDIQNLLMDTGLGAQSSYVISQGMVDEIISDNADERRHIFEEAAGVTRYKIRRRSAWNRLLSVQQDLQRIDDIIGEVERQVASLQRQERKARLYKTVSDELHNLEVLLARYRYFSMADLAKPMLDEMIFLKEDVEVSETDMQTLEARLEEARAELADQEQALAAANAEVSRQVDLVHTKDSQILIAREELRSLDAFIDRADRQQEDLGVRLSDARQGQEAAEQGGREAVEKLKINEHALEEETAVLSSLTDDLDARRTRVDEQKSQLMGLLRDSSERGRQLERLQADREGVLSRQARLHEDVERVTARQLEADDVAKRAEEQIVTLEGELSERSEQRQNRIDERSRLQTERDEQVEDRNRLRARIESDDAQIALLQKLREGFEGYSKGVRALAVDSPFADRIKGVVADLIDVEADHVAAIEGALGQALECLVVEGTDVARDAIDYLRDGGYGSAAFLPLERVAQGSGILWDVPVHDGVVGRASDLVVGARDATGAVRALLRRTLVVRDIQTALDVSPGMRSVHVDVVTLNGEVFAADGTVYGGADAESESGLIGRMQQIEGLESGIVESRDRLEVLEQDIRTTVEAFNELVTQIESDDRVLSELQNRRAGLQRDRQNSENEARRQAQAVTELEKETMQLATRETELGNLISESEKVVAEHDQRREALEDEVRQADDMLREQEQQRRAHQDTVAARRVEIASARERVEGLRQEAQRLAQEQTSISREMERLTGEREESGKRKGELDEVIRTASVELEGLHQVQTQVEQKRDQQAQHQHELMMATRAVEEELREKNRRVTQNREKLNKLELELTRMKERGNALVERIQRDYDVDVTELGSYEDPEFNDDMTDKKIIELQERLRRMGSVNLAALEEYDVQKERYEFLTTQRDDLMEAEDTLKRTITRVDRTARQRFLETFGRIRENFHNTFQDFFDGGEADLTMPLDEDPLEAPIVISARPGGKRLQSINLLSGGERALTAIALLFAIYQVKPSPFCILDEVDAPLDDANVDRFVRVVKKFSSQSQFIVVTHNKRTMEAGEILHGVTMEEPGVSKLVSVKMGKDDEPSAEVSLLTDDVPADD